MTWKHASLIGFAIPVLIFVICVILIKNIGPESNDPLPPQWKRVCLIETKIARVSNGYECACKPGVNLNNGNYDTECNIERVCNIYSNVCERWGLQCVIDPAYTGKEKSCPEIFEEKKNDKESSGSN